MRHVRPRVLALVAVVALVTGGCSTSSDEASAAGVAAARSADLDALLEATAALHPDPPDLGGRVAALRDRAADLTAEQWLVELMRLTATRDRDGHTGVLPLAQPDLRLWPVQLYAFDDGWRVVAAQDPYGQLVGRPVTGVGGVPVDEAVELAAPLVPHDNAATVRARVAQYLVVPDVLAGLGLEPELEVAGRAVELEAVPAAEYAEWSGAFDPLVVPALPPAPTVAFELATVDRAVVLGYHRVVRVSGSSTVASLAGDLRAQVEAVDAGRVVVDVRRNPGGENGSYPPLLAELQALARDRPGTVRVLVGRSTFSAATNFVAELLATTDAVLVGEPMGGSPNMWGDADVRTLPGSGVRVHVATRWWELGGRDERVLVEPDVAVPVRAADWAAGTDAALEAALAG